MIGLFKHKSEHVPAADLVEAPPDPDEGVGQVRELDAPTFERRPLTYHEKLGLRLEEMGEPPLPEPEPVMPTYVWTRQAPTEPGMHWCRLPWSPERPRLVQLVSGRHGLVVAGSGGRLARTAPCEWRVQA